MLKKDEPGRWVKGNLHCHTSVYEGKLNARQACDYYRNNGYDFLAITDHQTLDTRVGDDSTDDFLVIPGMELYADEELRTHNEHLVGLLDPELVALPQTGMPIDGDWQPRPVWKSENSMADIVTRLNRSGLQVIMAHPYASGCEPEDFFACGHAFGLEIINYACSHGGKGDSSSLYECLLRKGLRLIPVAGDDCHHYGRHDSLGAYTMVKTQALILPALLDAMRKGHCYASTGPEIHAFYCQDNKVYIETGRVREIAFFAYPDRGSVVCEDGKKWLTGACHVLSGKERYIRAEIIDHCGRKAWASPIWLGAEET